jgi:type IV secretory pathway protease TraF
LSVDPRVVAIPVNTAQAAALGFKIYTLASEPFKFPEAVLISGGGDGYGEVSFQLDAAQPGYVRVDNLLLKRLLARLRRRVAISCRAIRASCLGSW